MTLLPGTMLGSRYILGRVLGIGGFGITYKAFDTLYQQVCAVKEFAPSGLALRRPGELDMQVCGGSAVAYYQHGMTRFLEEAKMLKRLESVPAVVEVKECFQENNTAYFSMEFLDGTHLKKVVKAAGNTLESEDVIRMIAEIGAAMDVIHKSTGILHRDISPENIYLLKDGSVRILDFGSARQQTMDERQEFTVQFKHGFAPPEQYTRTGKQGSYTDVYALASTCYYALTGIRIPDAMDRLAGETYVPLCELRPDITVQVSEAVDRALVLDYQQRTRTMEDFVKGIKPEYTSHKGTGEAPEKSKKPFLEILEGSGAGVRWNLPINTEVRIGRSPNHSNIILTGEPNVSKLHCSLVYDADTDEFLLRDFSRNGVFVNGIRLEKSREYRYRSEVEFSLAVRTCKIKAGITYE